MRTVKKEHKLPRKEREKIIRRQEILQAAREIFALKGYHNTTLDEIAKHAEFGKGTIYNYFSSKEELFNGIIEKLMADMVEMTTRVISKTRGGAREKLTAYGRNMMAYARENSDLFQMAMREMHRLNQQQHEQRIKQIGNSIKKIWTVLAQPLSVEIKAGNVRLMDAVKAAALFDSMIRFYCVKKFGHVHTGSPEETEEAVAFVISVFFDGIAAGKGKG